MATVAAAAYDPNGLDNDVFFAFVRFVKDFACGSFNRWGELIFESTDVRVNRTATTVIN